MGRKSKRHQRRASPPSVKRQIARFALPVLCIAVVGVLLVVSIKNQREVAICQPPSRATLRRSGRSTNS